MSRILKLRRGSTAKMQSESKSSTVLKSGEIFLEYPNTGIGTGKSKLKVGDGKTTYSELPYALGGDISDDEITITSDGSSSVSEAISKILSGSKISTLFGVIKQALTILDSTLTGIASSKLDAHTSDYLQNVSISGSAGDVNRVITITFGDNTTKSLAIRDTQTSLSGYASEAYVRNYVQSYVQNYTYSKSVISNTYGTYSYINNNFKIHNISIVSAEQTIYGKGSSSKISAGATVHNSFTYSVPGGYNVGGILDAGVFKVNDGDGDDNYQRFIGINHFRVSGGTIDYEISNNSSKDINNIKFQCKVLCYN